MSDLSRRSLLAAIGATAPLAAGLGSAHAAGESRSRVPRELRPGGEFDRYLARLAAEDRFSGTVLLTHRGRPVLERSHRMADKRRRIPNGPDTIFILGSITKVFTALAIAQLAERDRVAYDEKVGAYVDGLVPEVAETVTVHHLITHSSGLGDFHSAEYFDAARHWDTEEEHWNGTLGFVRKCRPSFVPGSGQNYSNAGYVLLGAIVDAVSEHGYYDHIREHVFQAAGMTRSDFFTRPRWVADRRLAHPHGKEDGRWVDNVEKGTFMGTPAGGSFSSAPDLARFAAALQENRLLGPAYTHLYSSPKRPIAGDRWECYGVGGQLAEDQWILGHNGGSTQGVSCNVDWFPATGWTAVALGNYGDNSTADIARTLRELIARHG